MKAVNIQWDFEDSGLNEKAVEYVANSLGNTLDIPENVYSEYENGSEAQTEAISDYITDATGFCHKGFTLEPDDKNKEKVIDFLKAQIEQNCDKDGCYQMYFDYHDTITEDTVSEIYNRYTSEETKDTLFSQYFEQAMYERLTDAEMFTENELFKEIEKNAQTNPEISELFKEFTSENDLRDLLYEAGYNGVTYDLSDIIDEYRLNVMFATKSEQNYDMSSICDSYMGDRNRITEQSFDNALTYLIHQQGHTVEEVLNAVDKIIEISNDDDATYKDIEAYGVNNGFAESVAYELYNNPDYCMTELTALVSIKGMNGIEVLDTLSKNEGNIVISKDTDIGLYNEWQGAGSLLEIKLDKPLVIPAEMVRNIQIEGGRHEYGGYTVDDTYGLVRSAWKGSLDKTTEQPELIQENITATISKFKERSEKSKSQNIER